MDHMKLLKQGVEEEAAACPPQFRLENAYVDPVAKVEALSAQLIILVCEIMLVENKSCFMRLNLHRLKN